MKTLTLADVLPDVPRKSRHRYAAALRSAGAVSPVSRGSGLAHAYTQDAAALIRAVADLVRVSGLSIDDAVTRVAPSRDTSDRLDTPRDTPRHTPRDTEQAAPDPLADLRAQLAEAEAARIRDREELAAALKAERADRIQTAEKLRDLDEERRNARARIARLESERKAPQTFRDRVRAAWRVLLGRSAAVAALPEQTTASEDLSKAA